MNQETYEDLHAKYQLQQELEESLKKQFSKTVKEKVEEEAILILSDDEIDMIKAYRNQVSRKASGLFRWRYSDGARIVTPENPQLIVDPRDESE